LLRSFSSIYYAGAAGKSSEELMGEMGVPLLKNRDSEDGEKSNLSDWRSVSGGSASDTGRA
jgi:hypothetical protein